MINHSAAEVLQCFDITAFGMIAIIKSAIPLPDCVVLKASGVQWRIKGRVCYAGFGFRQQTFEGQENHIFFHPHYSSPEKKIHAEHKLEQQEREGIFHYLIEPLGHEQKPVGTVELTR